MPRARGAEHHQQRDRSDAVPRDDHDQAVREHERGHDDESVQCLLDASHWRGFPRRARV
jgi:hypothetical protein